MQILGRHSRIGIVLNWIRLIAVLLAACIILIGVVVWLMAYMLLRPPRMTDGKAAWVLKRISPGDLGLPFRPLTFQIRDMLTGQVMKMAAWWIPHPRAGGRCAVLIHGYADAKVGAIAWGPLFHELGYNILAVDLRAHGESDGRFITSGYFERHDFNQILDQVRAEMPGETRHLMLFGVSLGAATALATAALRDDIEAIVLESPVGDFRDAAMVHGELMGWPGGAVGRLVLRVAEWMSKADFAEVRPLSLLRRVGCPVMIIQGELDPLTSQNERAEIEEIFRKRAADFVDVYWRLPGTGHVMGICDDPESYKQRIAEFLLRVAESSDGRDHSNLRRQS